MAQTVRDVLARHRVSLNEEDVAVALECTLIALSAPAAAPLTAAEIDYLTEHADPAAAEAIKSWNSQSEHDERVAAAATLSSKVLGSTLGIDGCAEKLGVDRSPIAHRISGGILYSFTAVGTRRRIPAWQFVGADLLPGLDKVVRAIPAGAHPLDLSALMTTPSRSWPTAHRSSTSPAAETRSPSSSSSRPSVVGDPAQGPARALGAAGEGAQRSAHSAAGALADPPHRG